MPVVQHLNERQRAIEIAAALYVMGFGGYIGTAISLGIHPPLAWTGWGTATQVNVAWLMCMAGLTHAIGVRVNGNWRWSPLLRLAGMTAHFAFIIAIWLRAPGMSTAQYTYAWLAVFLWIGLASAWRDSLKAVRDRYGPDHPGTVAEGP